MTMTRITVDPGHASPRKGLMKRNIPSSVKSQLGTVTTKELGFSALFLSAHSRAMGCVGASQRGVGRRSDLANIVFVRIALVEHDP